MTGQTEKLMEIFETLMDSIENPTEDQLDALNDLAKIIDERLCNGE